MLAAGATNGNGTTTTSAAPPTAQPAPPVTTAAAVVPVEGAFVLDVEADGAAAEAGVHKGDIVVAVDDVPVPSMNALVLLIRERKAGSEVHLTVVRDGERLELVTVLRGRKKS
jgi:S1-C subfamily serine protease